MRERSVHLVVFEAPEQEPALSLTAAVRVVPDTLHGWSMRAEIDTGRRPRVTHAQ